MDLIGRPARGVKAGAEKYRRRNRRTRLRSREIRKLNGKDRVVVLLPHDDRGVARIVRAFRFMVATAFILAIAGMEKDPGRTERGHAPKGPANHAKGQYGRHGHKNSSWNRRIGQTARSRGRNGDVSANNSRNANFDIRLNQAYKFGRFGEDGENGLSSVPSLFLEGSVAIRLLTAGVSDWYPGRTFASFTSRTAA